MGLSKENLLKDLRNLGEYFIGLEEQNEIYEKTLKELRELFSKKPELFEDKDFGEINRCKNKIELIKVNKKKKEFNFARETPEDKSPKKGDVVFHKKRFFVGVIDGKTSMENLFEEEDSQKEFRVRRVLKKVEIAAEKNLIIIGECYTNHCYKCRSFIGIFLEKCSACGWFICENCGSCGCQYRGSWR